MTPAEYDIAKALIADSDARITEIDDALANTRKLYLERDSVLEQSKPLREAVNVYEQALRQAEKEARDADRAAVVAAEEAVKEAQRAESERLAAEAEEDAIRTEPERLAAQKLMLESSIAAINARLAEITK